MGISMTYDCTLGVQLTLDFVFSKTLVKEDIADGFEAVIDALPEKKGKKEPEQSNGINDGIVLEGAD